MKTTRVKEGNTSAGYSRTLSAYPRASSAGTSFSSVRNILDSGSGHADGNAKEALENISDHETTDLEQQLEQSEGSAIPEYLKLIYRDKMNGNLDAIRVHNDEFSHRISRQLDATAFAYRNHIFFARDQFSPGTSSGRRTFSHELAHVLQYQRGMDAGFRSGAVIRKIPRVPEDTPFQAEVRPWSTPLHRGPSRESLPWVDLPRGHVVTVLGGEAWIHVRTEINGRTLEGYVSHELLRRLPERQQPEDEQAADDVADEIDNEPAPREPYRGGFEPLQARVSEASEFWVRATPDSSGTRIGMLPLQPLEVTVLEEHGTRVDNLWFKVRFTEADYLVIVERYRRQLQADLGDARRSVRYWEEVLPRAGQGTQIVYEQLQDARSRIYQINADIAADQARDLSTESPEGWVGAAAFAQVLMPWAMFLDLVSAFEASHRSDSLRDRITRLRQIGEDGELEGDSIIGYGEDISGRITQDQRTVNSADWQLLLETKAVVMPNGEVIDFHHFVLGLDTLPVDRRSENYRAYGLLSMGQNYAIVTWSGDVGAAATEFAGHLSRSWERDNPVSEDERARFYFRTRSPDADLWGDIDSWGAYTQISTNSGQQHSSIVDLLTENYGGRQQTAAEYEATVSSVRASGIENFLRHYGFNRSVALSRQTAAVSRVRQQVHTFADAWGHFQLGGLTNGLDEDDLNDGVDRMTALFLEWLEQGAARYNVSFDD